MVKVLFKFILLFMSIVFSNNLDIAENVENAVNDVREEVNDKIQEESVKGLQNAINGVQNLVNNVNGIQNAINGVQNAVNNVNGVQNAVNVNDGYAKMFKDLQKKQSESHLKELYHRLNLPIAPKYLPRQQVFNIVYLYHSIRQACFPILIDNMLLPEPFHNNFDDLVSHHILHQQENWSNFNYYSKYVLNKYTDKVYINTFSEKIFEWNNINFTALGETKLNLTYIEKAVIVWGWRNNELNQIMDLIKEGELDRLEYLEEDEKNSFRTKYKKLQEDYGYTGQKYIVTEFNNHFSWPYICSKSLSPTENWSSHAYCILIDAPEEDEKIQGYLKYGFIDSLEKLNFFDASNSKFFINLENMLSVLSDSINVIILEINDRFDSEGFEYLQFAIFYFVFILVTLRFLYQFFDKGESNYNGFRKYYFLLFIYYIFQPI